MVTSSWLTRIETTPGAVGTTVTVPLATFSPSTVAMMVALPRLLAVKVHSSPSPSTETTLFSLLVQRTSGSAALLSTPLRVAVAVSPTTMFFVENSSS